MRAGRGENFQLAVIGARKNCARRSLIAVSLAGLSLAGCAERQQTVVQDVKVTPPVISEASLHALTRYRISGVPPRPVGRARHEAPEKKEAPERKPAEFDPVTFVGMAPPDISRILGQPVDTREEAMSIEWIYTAPACSLVIFFYPDIATGALRALKYNVNDAKDGAARDCVQQFILAKGNDHG